MLVSVDVDARFHRANVIYGGIFRTPDIAHARRALLSEGVGAGYSILADFRPVETFACSGPEIRDVARKRGGLPWVNSSTRVALVAPAGEAFGVARMLESTRDPRDDPWWICKTLEQAEAILHPRGTEVCETGRYDARSNSVVVVTRDDAVAERFIERIRALGLDGVRVDDVLTAERVLDSVIVRAIVWFEAPSGSELAIRALADKTGVSAFELWPHQMDLQIETLLV